MKTQNTTDRCGDAAIGVQRRSKIVSGAIFAGLLLASDVWSAAITWTNTAGGEWSGAGNWNNSVPAEGDQAFIGLSGQGFTVNYDLPMSAGSISNLTMDNLGGTLLVTLNINTNGFNVLGSVAHAVRRTTRLNVNPGGVMSITLGSFSVADGVDPNTGLGKAEMYLQGGIVTNNASLQIGGGANATGIVTITDGTWVQKGLIRLGRNGGFGTLNIYGGEFRQESGLDLFLGESGRGVLNVTNGSVLFSPSTPIILGNSAGMVGIANLSGGTVTSTVVMTIGNAAGSTGLVHVTGGSWVSTANTIVGALGQGTLQVGGGSFSTLRLVVTNGTRSTLHLDGGGEAFASELILRTNSIFEVTLNGPTLGSQYGQVVVTNSAALSNSTLRINMGYEPTPGDTFTLIDNQSVNALFGQFAGYTNGQHITVRENGEETGFFHIYYNGGTGANDLVLIAAIPEPSALPLAALALTGLLARRRLRKLGPRIVVVLAMLSAGSLSFADRIYTNSAGGEWNVAGNWDFGIPGSGDIAWVGFGRIYTVTYDTPMSALSISNLNVDNLGGLGDAVLHINTNGFNVSHGIAVRRSGVLHVNAGGVLSLASGNMQIGASDPITGRNKGDMTVNGGIVTNLGSLQVGHTPNATGTVTVTSGTWIQNGLIRIARNGGLGILNIYGGEFRQAAGNDLYVGEIGHAILNVTNGSVLFSPAAGIILGGSAGTVGTANLSGGTITNTTLMTIGSAAGATGLVHVTGGSWVSTANTIVGALGQGTLQVGGGSFSTLRLVVTNDTRSTLHLDGGGEAFASELIMRPNSIFDVTLNGPTLGSEYGQVVVTNSAALSNSTLRINMGYEPTPGDTFTLIDNQSVNALFGQFAGYTNGQHITVRENGEETGFFHIYYNGGTGANDLVLIAAIPEPSAGLLVGAASLVLLLRRRS